MEIDLINIEKAYGKHKVLKSISLKCRPGTITGIVGRNGAGKTVLFKAICGLVSIDSGEIKIDGRIKKSGSILSSAGVIIEGPAFLSNASGIKNLMYLYTINNKLDKKHLEDVMRKVGLNPSEKKTVSKYSMGMKQRLAIAQAIMEDPECLILDEPFNGLDNKGVDEIRSLLLDLKKAGKTILVASHNPEDIRILCDEVYEMDDGIMTRKKIAS
ncbi:ABC-2 type transport system ATP-binding protein [Butyrivibrio fibrisolvens DSM 3071]|uniref:ABC-2 type transport system ATP-binding protein n=1 Tax=Butyrivibrio fibrisolvens DSM 3071 TaxID=1121131 RepID=A0A1M5UWD3_BUTFI|nr:ABC transporter ATP-binding protein [Butyrivibrio fibrisolvens]SHH67230.1 ABC-2 type transport system ATP-binding protein [Butyrivibrio fibrisolvens DSM 3071]